MKRHPNLKQKGLQKLFLSKFCSKYRSMEKQRPLLDTNRQCFNHLTLNIMLWHNQILIKNESLSLSIY